MNAAFALLLLIAQPVPKENDRNAKRDLLIAKVVEADPKDTPLRKLQKERCRERAAAVKRIEQILALGKYEPAFFTDYIKLQMTLWENVAEVVDKPADKVKCYEQRLDGAKELERLTTALVEAGNAPPQSLNIAKANRIDAEIDLLKLKAEVEKGGKK